MILEFRENNLINVVIYVNKNCPECETVITLLEKLQTEFPHSLKVIDIEENPDLLIQFAGRVPFVKTGPYSLSGDIDEKKLRMTLGAAIDRSRQLTEVGDENYKKRLERGAVLTKTDRVTYWLSRSYIWLISLFLLLYVGLPFLAPVFMKAGMDLPAKVIYTVYKPLCHQLSFRSWFIYGEQFYYPRELAGLTNVMTYEQITGNETIDIRAAQRFVGNEVVGFKVALCERDTAIYGSMLLFALIFIVSGRRIKPLPWYFWLIFGLIPIGLDGFSQLPGLSASLPAWLPHRESTPLLRTITGSLFGLLTAWYLFPLIEESMRETRSILSEKIAIIRARENK